MRIILPFIVIFYNLFLLIFISIIYCYKRNYYCMYDKILASGASYNHGNLLLLMIKKVIETNNMLCFIIWDLGLSKYQRKIITNIVKLQNSKNNKKLYFFFHIFNFNKYPIYFNINVNAGCYAWKPVIIDTTYKLYKRTLFWLDAGCFINGSLQNIYNYINTMKIWSISTGHTIKRYTYHSVLDLFNVSENIKSITMCAAGVIGFYYPSAFCIRILSLWKKCAMSKKCIAPNGSNRKNHRQDQSALSIILYQNNYNFSCLKYDNLNFSLQFDGKIHKYKFL